MIDVSNLFNKQLSLFRQSPYPSIKARKNNLKAIKCMLQKETAAITDAIDRDYQGRSCIETHLLEIFPSIQALKFSARHVQKWAKSRTRWLGPWLLPARAKIMPQPKGVVGFVVPWNYPLYLTIAPLANALAAGNCVMIKLSDQSNHLATLLKTLLQKHAIERVEIVSGDVDVAKAFCNLPFNHLLYTGSTEVGKSVMLQASENLTPVTLELGGKSPVIISATAKTALYTRLFMGKFLNAGQTCIAPDYVFLPDDKKGVFIESAKAALNRHYPEFENNKDYSTIISKKHMERLEWLKNDAIEKGAEVISLANGDRENKLFPPTLLFNVTPEMAVTKDEIFGPLLPVLLYKNPEDVLEHLTANARPLAIYYFGHDKEELNRLKKHTHSGSLTVNDTLIQAAADNLPFGGIGRSGMGHYHGREGFETFSKMKPIFTQGRFSSFSLLYPPYGKFTRFFLKAVAGIKQ